MAATQVIEERVRLSKSQLWDLQKEAYIEWGQAAWSEKAVPTYLTTNPFITRRYAQVAFAFLEEGLAKGIIDPKQPFYIFDLGAGTGRLAYLFLKSFLALYQTLEKRPPLSYVATDVVPANLEAMKSHPFLKPFVELGVLDFCLYDADLDQSFKLESGDHLIPNKVKNPPVVIANYLFASLAQDLFKKEAGNILEGKVSFKVNKEGLDPNSPDVLNELSLHKAYADKVDPKTYYDSSWLAKHFSNYCEQFGEGEFTYPLRALQIVDLFERLSPNGCCLLAADHGASCEEHLKELEGFRFATHGCFSISVNYDAIAHYLAEKKARVSFTPAPDPLFIVFQGLIGNAAELRQAQLAWQNAFSSFEPADYWHMVNLAEKRIDSLEFDEIFHLIKLGDWDPGTFQSLFPGLKSCFDEGLDEGQILKFNQGLNLIFDHFFPQNCNEGFIVLNMGTLLYLCDHYQAALNYFQRHYIIGGESPMGLYNMGLCLQHLAKSEEASLCFNRAKELDPHCSYENIGDNPFTIE